VSLPRLLQWRELSSRYRAGPWKPYSYASFSLGLGSPESFPCLAGFDDPITLLPLVRRAERFERPEYNFHLFFLLIPSPGSFVLAVFLLYRKATQSSGGRCAISDTLAPHSNPDRFSNEGTPLSHGQLGLFEKEKLCNSSPPLNGM